MRHGRRTRDQLRTWQAIGGTTGSRVFRNEREGKYKCQGKLENADWKHSADCTGSVLICESFPTENTFKNNDCLLCKHV